MNEVDMVKIENITKVFEGKRGKVIANDGISLSVNQGEIIGLLGHNGAGKTTLVNQMLGLLKPTSGEITIMGQSIVRNPKQGRMLCSVQPQSQLSLGELSPLKAVTIMGQMRGGNETEMNAEAMRLFEALDITEWMNKECNQLSVIISQQKLRSGTLFRSTDFSLRTTGSPLSSTVLILNLVPCTVFPHIHVPSFYPEC